VFESEQILAQLGDLDKKLEELGEDSSIDCDKDLRGVGGEV
jgi:hypothetical protein